MTTAATPREIAESLNEFWSPRVIAEVDDSYIKVAKVTLHTGDVVTDKTRSLDEQLRPVS